MGEIKHCPCCGGNASVYEDARFHAKPYDFPKWYIQCHDCGLRTPIGTTYQIVKIWNRRKENDL